ncbi:hypothetical protein M413DRAFT_445935 [Hebeloma cylindrosporum]|uniref:C2 domain-containing protein n=1 Tax=Hebeloma cylindrosporum TaxID=76867 RepID=A0A0C3BUY8_HEBCY|nr:hypothetical protein M413DRAFT_445935 [Hebeloma cylindrosporum h7]
MSKTTINLDDTLDKEDSIGTLIVVLLKARNLNDKHKFRKQDVFAQASLNGAQKKTHVDIKGGQHPEWDGEVRFTIMKNATAKYRKLEVSCYAQEPRSEDLLGKGIVDISETLRTGEFDDWVPLDIDGVARGELYLEMTYYANTPPPAPSVAAAAPNKLLSAVQSQHNALTRRPSKLSPADRLSRIPQQQPQGYLQSRPENQLPPRSPQSPTYPVGPSPPAKGRYDTLAVADARPNPYLSSGPRPGSSGQGQHQQPAAPGLPAFLRPGSGGQQSAPTPIPHAPGHVRHSSDGAIPSNSYGSPNRYAASLPHVPGSVSPPNPYIGGTTPPSNPYLGNNGSSHNPYIGGGNTLAPTPAPGPPSAYSPAPQPINTAVPPVQGHYTTYGHPQQPPAGAPLLWRSDNMSPPLEAPSNGSFYFPIPVVSPARESFNHYNARPGPSPAPLSMDMAYHQRPSPPRDERDLQARYQTPLPLPPGAERPLPKSAPPPAPDPAPAPAPRPVYSRTPTPPPKNSTPVPVPDRTRVEAQRRAEEEAARRREQELKDLELAMQLDRELNLAEERAAAVAASTRPGMPGSW